MSIFTKSYPSGEMIESYRGCCLADRERNGYDDSDFYAIVWDEEQKRTIEIEFATTRFGGTDQNYVTIDATPDVLRKAARYHALLAYRALVQRARQDAQRPLKGRTVRVVRGRKIPQGIEAIVGWYGEGAAYGWARYHSHGPMRVGLVRGTEKLGFTDAYNVEVVNPAQYLPRAAELRAAALRNAGHRSRLPQAVPPGFVLVA